MLLKRTKLIEKYAVALCYAAIVVLKILALKTQAINTDEPQHLHVVWGWTAGLVQYRDVFDNHTPLFHLLFAPVLKLVLYFTGETVSAFFAMRAAMSVIFVINGWLTFRLLESLGVKSRVGRHLLTLLALTLPYSFVVSDEFRTDNLWVTAWLLVLLVLMRAQKITDYMVLGAALAVCALVSFKTLTLIAGVGSASLVVVAVEWRSIDAAAFRLGVKRGIALLAGVLIVLALFVADFLALGAFNAMLYGVVQHNLVPALGNWKHDGLKFAFPLSIAAAYILARIQRRPPRIWIVLLHGGLTAFFFISFWPLITPQDFLPLYPLAPLFVLWVLPGKLRHEVLWWPLAFVTIAAFLFVNLEKIEPWSRLADPMIDEIRAMLALTTSKDYVMDEKGEALFRRRPFYFALERLTLERFKRGTIADLIPEQLRITDTKVVRLYKVFPNTEKFLNANYLPVIHYTQVAGQRLQGDLPLRFTIEIPAEYVFLHDGKIIPVTIDGNDSAGSAVLGTGEHVIQKMEFPRVFLFWRKAYDLGFSPHDPESIEYKRIEPFQNAGGQ